MNKYTRERQNTRTREVNLSSRAKQSWGPEYNRPDVGYVFSNNRKFLSSDRSDSGLYEKS